MGPAVGMAGCAAALEAIKIIMFGDCLESKCLCGKLLWYNGLEWEQRIMKIAKKKDCMCNDTEM